VELRILLQAARTSARRLASAAVLGALVGWAVWNALPVGYQASAVLVMDSTAITVPGQAPFTGDPERYVTGELESLRSYDVATRAAASLQPSMSPQELLASIDLTHVTGSDVVGVTARADSPQRAVDMANAVSSAYIQRRKAAAQGALQDQKHALERQAQQIADRLTNEKLAQPVANSLYAAFSQVNASIAQLEQPGVLRDATRIVDTARTPVSTRALGLSMSVAAAALLGALAVLGVAVVRAIRQPRIAGRDDIELLLGRPLSAVFPRVRRLRKRARETSFDRLSEAAGRLAALTGAGAEESRPLVITCCSAVSSAGCSTVSAALALRMASDGYRVTAVTTGDGTPLIPLVQRAAAPSPVPVRAGAAGPAATVDRGWHSAEGVVPGLTVISHGSQRLTAEDYRKGLADAAAGTDVIVVDASSVLDSTFAAAAVRESDRVVLVVPVGQQSESDLRLAFRLIDEATDDPVLVVATHL
jgi:capsular polysaccharide biosynthesis protein